MTPDSLQRLIDHHRDVAQHHQHSYDWVAAKFAASKYAAPPGIVDDAVTAKFRFTLWADKHPGYAIAAKHDLEMAAIHRETAEALEAPQSKLRAEVEAMLIAADEADEA
jgi:hypothetical protein